MTEEDVYNHTANSPSLSAPKTALLPAQAKASVLLETNKEISSKECNHLGEGVLKSKTKPDKRNTFLNTQPPPEHFKSRVPVYLQIGHWASAYPSNLFLPQMIQVVPPTSTPTHPH